MYPMPVGSLGMPPTDPGNIYMTPSRVAPVVAPSVPRNIPPRNSQTPKALMALLATLVLNKRLQQGGMNQPPGMLVRQATPGHQRMADLARMSLSMGRRPSGY